MQLEVEIIDNDNLGNGIAKVNGKVLFVKYAIKGEKVLVKIVKENKKYSVGKIIKVLKPVENRIEVMCPYFYKCGGCSFFYLSSSLENDIKLDYVKKMFSNIKIDIITSDSLFYRNKAVFHVKNGKIGFYYNESNELLEIDKCLLLDEKINLVLDRLKKIKLKDGDILVRSTTLNEVMVRSLSYLDITLLKDVASSIYIGDKCVYGKEFVNERIGNVNYIVYPDTFFQVNKFMVLKLYDVILDYSRGYNSLLDLYCGVGSISLYLKDYFSNIVGVEVNSSSVSSANYNKKINNANDIKFVCSDAKDVDIDNFDLVIV